MNNNVEDIKTHYVKNILTVIADEEIEDINFV